MNGSTRRAVTVTAAVAALIGGGLATAIAAIPAADGTITACIKKSNEYFPKSGKCKKGYKAVKWNVQGPTGPAGPAGNNANINGVAAGGDLTGAYPNPTLKVDAVSSLDVLNGSLIVADLVREDIFESVNLPSVPGGTCTSFNLPVTTSASDPVAVVNPPGNFFNTPGLVFNWNVGINPLDPVTVHVCNVTAGAIDPASGGWRAILFAG